MPINEKIKKLRKENNLTQNDLAQILNVAPTTISAWELGRNKPLLDKIYYMADYFKIPIVYFFDNLINQQIFIDDRPATQDEIEEAIKYILIKRKINELNT